MASVIDRTKRNYNNNRAIAESMISIFRLIEQMVGEDCFLLGSWIFYYFQNKVPPENQTEIEGNLHTSALSVRSGCQPEVSDLDDHAIRQEHVAWLQISMNNFLGVNIRDPCYHLLHVVSCFRLRDFATVLQHVHQALRNKNRTLLVYSYALL